jgi:hypothetical protein
VTQWSCAQLVTPPKETSISMLIAVAGPEVKCPVNKVRSITSCTTDNVEDKKVWLTNVRNSLITLLQLTAASGQIPLTRETQPGFSPSDSSDMITLQNAPILQPVLIPQPQLSQEELIRVRRNLAEQERILITMEQQGKLIITMLSELISLKRSTESGPEDITPAAKKACIDEVMKKMMEVKQEKNVARLQKAAKNLVMHKRRAKLGLHPTTRPTGPMANCSLYFN